MGRIGSHRDGMGKVQPFAGVYRIMAAVRRAVRTVSRPPCRSGAQPDVGRTVPVVGLAGAVRPEPHSGGDRALDSPRYSRDPGLYASRPGTEDRTHADA